MSVMAWAATAIGAIVVLLALAVWIVELARRATAAKLKEVERERNQLRAQIADLVATIVLVNEPEPTAGELLDAAGQAVASAGGLSEAEQRAMDRILRARAASRARASDG